MNRHLRTNLSVVVVLALSVLPSSAGAAFVGLAVEDVSDNSLGLKEYAFYAVFDDPDDRLIGVTSNVSVTTTFYHSAVNGQKSSLPWTVEQNSLADTPDVDSFVTIGLSTGDGNVTFLLDSFDDDAFLTGSTMGEYATWTGISQGLAGQDLKVLVAVLAPTLDSRGAAGIVSGSLTFAISTPGPRPPLFITEYFTTVPGPAAVALLCALPILDRRRRRGDAMDAA